MTGDVPFAAMSQGEESPTSTPEARPDEAVPEDSFPAAAPQHGYVGFTLRELIMAGLWLIAFVLSFVPAAGSVLDSSATVWTMNGAWLLTIGVPTAAVFLVVLRRLSPEGIRRVGSLGIDQFASVAFSVALVSWAVLLWQQLDLVAAMRRSALATWPLWLEVASLLGLVVVSVFAVLIPGLREDFEGRTDTLAHRNANPVRPVFTRPRPVRARGSVSDPQNEDDVDPGLLHENEVDAGAHLSAGATGAAIFGGAGYVPDHHRESFVASEAGAEDTAVRADESAARTAESGVAESAAGEDAGDAPTAGAAVAEALTEAILEAEEPATVGADPGTTRQELREDDRTTGADSRRDAEASETTQASAPTESSEAEPSPSAPSEDDPADAGDRSPVSHDLSDTMTEVLGDLLVPSPEDEVATHAVDVVAEERRGSEPAQPFWALAPETRPVHDARGDEIFTIGPDAWILVLEDRGGAFVVRHDDGRVGYLHDTDNMTRG